MKGSGPKKVGKLVPDPVPYPRQNALDPQRSAGHYFLCAKNIGHLRGIFRDKKVESSSKNPGTYIK